jgi:Na+(H+)/acetate symporter ActP
MRAVSLNQAALGVLLLAAALGAIAVLRWQGGGVQGEDGVGAASLVFSLRSSADRIAVALTVAAGAACFPHVLMHGFLAPTVKTARTSFFWGALFLALLSLTAATGPEIFKAALLGSVSRLEGGPLLFCTFAANLAIALGLLIVISNALGHDLYFKTLQRMATQARQLAVLRAMPVIVAAVTALIVLSGHEMSDWATGSLSLAAAAFFPALVLGIWWRRTNRAGAIAGMVAGVALALFYFLAPHYFPVQFYEAMSGLSGASQDQWPHYLTLKQAAGLADGYAKQAAVEAWVNGARKFATWGGVDRHYGAVFAVPLGFLVTIVVSLCTARPPADIENFVGELGKGRD